MGDFLWTNRPPAGWHVGAGPGAVSLIEEVLTCLQVWRWMTRRQRDAVLAATDDQVAAHPATMRTLRGRQLVDDDGRLTPAGARVRKWNLPKEAK